MFIMCPSLYVQPLEYTHVHQSSTFSSSLPFRIDTLSKALSDMAITGEQKTNMESFLSEKRSIVAKGEMKEQHFLRMEELGFGNGGVVLKVQHKPTGIIMARKVRVQGTCDYHG